MDHFKNVFSLEGRTALIVGGGGLGLPIAQALMENGADIIVADLKEPEGWIGDLAKENGRRFFYVHVNLLEDDSIVKMVAEARQKTGRIDILVNAAGVNKLKKAEDYDAQTWDFVLGINLRALHLTTKEVGKLMIEQGYGRILSISSVKSLIARIRIISPIVRPKVRSTCIPSSWPANGVNTELPSTPLRRPSPARRSIPSSWMTRFFITSWWNEFRAEESAQRRIWAARPSICAAMRRSLSAVRCFAWMAA